MVAETSPQDPRPSVDGPRNEWLIALAVLALGTLVLCYPALSGMTLLNENSDQYIAGYAFRDFAAQSLRAGHGFPLWSPYLFGGMPYVAAMHGDIFYPTFLLRLLMSTDAAMTWGMILHVFLAGVFTFLFVRRALGVGFFGALLGGLAYEMGGNVGGLVSPGHDGKIFVAALLPLSLFFVHRAVRDGRAWAWGSLALSVTLAVLTPHPQLLQYLLLMCGGYALFLAFSAGAGGAKLSTADAMKRLVFAGVAVGVGMLGGAIQFLPLFEYTPWSPRAGGKGWEHAISYSLPPEELINTYLPQFSGMLTLYSGRNGIHLHSEYIGAAVLVLVGLAFGSALLRRSVIWFWGGALVVSLLWALGGYTPFFSIIYTLVPGTKFFRAPSTMLYVVSFCTAVLAAIGADRALRGTVKTRYAIGWVVFGVLIAVAASAGAIGNMSAGFALPGREARVEDNASQIVVGAWRSFAMLLPAAGVVWLLARKKIAPVTAAWVLVAVTVVDLWTVEKSYWRFAPPAKELYAADAATTFLASAPTGRVWPIAVQQLTGTRRDPFLGSGEGKGTGFMVHGVRSVAGYHGNELGRYDELTGWDTDEYMKRMSNPRLWQLLNVRYLYTNAPESPLPGAPRLAGPARNAAGDMVSVYKLPGDNPPAWVVPVSVKLGDAQLLPTLLDERFDPLRIAMFDTATTVKTVAPPTTVPEPLAVTVKADKWEPGHIALTLDGNVPAGASLIVSENFYPGWTATVDGKPTAVGRADYVLTGVELPEGAKQVELSFQSAPYETGKTLTLGAMLAAVLALVVGIVMDRKRSVVA